MAALRLLGINPSSEIDELEAVLILALNNRVVRDQGVAAGG